MPIRECLRDAEQNNMNGVAVVVRKGTWMAGPGLFFSEGFEVCDTAPPDFKLLVKKTAGSAANPSFANDWEGKLQKYSKGLYIFTSDQCPYTHKAIVEIGETAEKEFGFRPEIIELKTAKDAREAPCPFGTFCMILNGRLIADHPISRTRFRNIMKSEN